MLQVGGGRARGSEAGSSSAAGSREAPSPLVSRLRQLYVQRAQRAPGQGSPAPKLLPGVSARPAREQCAFAS